VLLPDVFMHRAHGYLGDDHGTYLTVVYVLFEAALVNYVVPDSLKPTRIIPFLLPKHTNISGFFFSCATPLLASGLNPPRD
jgi:hypothetical protein